MIVILIGMVTLGITLLLTQKAVDNKNKSEIVTVLGIPIALIIMIVGITEPTKMRKEWEIKEAMEATLISNENENTSGGYTYQYRIPERWKVKPKIINCVMHKKVAPILVKCERKAEPTIWTLGLGYKETKYVFYFPDDNDRIH